MTGAGQPQIGYSRPGMQRQALGGVQRPYLGGVQGALAASSPIGGSNPNWSPAPVAPPQMPNFQPLAMQLQQQIAQMQAAKAAQAQAAQPQAINPWLLESGAPGT